MHKELFDLFGVVSVTGWKLVGWLGVFMFASRWLIQITASRSHRRPVFPRLFWYMSLSGSLLLLTYFIFGKNDSVGILSNLFPCVVAGYNLFLDIRHHRESRENPPNAEPMAEPIPKPIAQPVAAREREPAASA